MKKYDKDKTLFIPKKIVKYIEPIECVANLSLLCNGSFVPTKKSPDMCIKCFNNKGK